ncbi:MAG: APC family permease [Nocardioidaceae bacterium]
MVDTTESSVPDNKSRTLAGSALGPMQVLAIAVAAISPTTSVFLVYGDGVKLAGTGVVWAFVIGGVIALSMALCYAEVGSVFPSAGGAYTIVRRALGPVFGGMVSVLFLMLGVVITASILVASATYLSSLVPGGLPVNWIAFAMMVLVTGLSIGRINPASWVAGAMLVLELLVILAFTGFAFAHPALHTDPFSHPTMPTGHGGALAAVGIGALFAAVVPALFAFNGYDWPLYFAEEARNARRVLPRAVLLAAGLSVVIELLAVIAATYAVRNVGVTAAATSPLSDIAHTVMGSVGANILLAGVVIAMFDTGLAGNLAYARIYYAGARDKMWPFGLNRLFGHLGERTHVPVYGFLVLFVGNGLLCIFSSLNTLVTFTGVVIVTIYLMVAVSALVCRVRDRGLPRPFRMPLWPLPPLIAVVGVVIALSQQTSRDLAVALGVAVVSLVVYAALRHRLPARLEYAPSDALGSTAGQSADGPSREAG